MCLFGYSLPALTLHPLSGCITVSLPHIIGICHFQLVVLCSLSILCSCILIMAATFFWTVVFFQALLTFFIHLEKLLALHFLCFVLITSRFFLLFVQCRLWLCPLFFSRPFHSLTVPFHSILCHLNLRHSNASVFLCLTLQCSAFFVHLIRPCSFLSMGCLHLPCNEPLLLSCLHIHTSSFLTRPPVVYCITARRCFVVQAWNYLSLLL